jgi:opacity protein-like surface antigen
MFVIVALMLTLSSVVPAQTDTSLASTKTPEVMLWGGLSLPYLPLDYRTFWKSGYNIGAGIGYSLDPGSTGYGSFFATLDYGRTNFDTKKYNDSLKLTHPADSAIGGAVTLVNVMVIFKGSFSSTKKSVAPYFLLGVGVMNFTVAETYFTPNTSLTIPGINKWGVSWTFGVGIEAPVTESVRAFVQAKSLLGVTEQTRQYFPITAGVVYTL